MAQVHVARDRQARPGFGQAPVIQPVAQQQRLRIVAELASASARGWTKPTDRSPRRTRGRGMALQPQVEQAGALAGAARPQGAGLAGKAWPPLCSQNCPRMNTLMLAAPSLAAWVSRCQASCSLTSPRCNGSSAAAAWWRLPRQGSCQRCAAEKHRVGDQLHRCPASCR
jgi:hypothetical protein